MQFRVFIICAAIFISNCGNILEILKTPYLY